MMNEFDINFYVKIIEFIETQLSNGKDLTAVISKTFIKLVKRLECENNREFIGNGIVLTTSYIRNPSAHQYNNIGIKSKDLELNDKEEMLSFLRGELLPN